MPRYDYSCTSCGQEFELVQSFQEAGSGTCPACSGVGRRLFHAVPVIYKGSGFYTTDYGRPKTPPSDDKDKEGEKDKKAKEVKATATDGTAKGPDSKGDSAAKPTIESGAKTTG